MEAPVVLAVGTVRHRRRFHRADGTTNRGLHPTTMSLPREPMPARAIQARIAAGSATRYSITERTGASAHPGVPIQCARHVSQIGDGASQLALSAVAEGAPNPLQEIRSRLGVEPLQSAVPD